VELRSRGVAGKNQLEQTTTWITKQNMSLRLSQSLFVTGGERGMTVLSFCNHAAIFLVGMLLALIFFMPNGMLSDSGTPIAVCASMFGMLACLLFAGGGCVGLVTGSWSTLLPGLIAQAALLVFMLLLGFLDRYIKIPGLHRSPSSSEPISSHYKNFKSLAEHQTLSGGA
jgi:hypothetical protein